MQKVLVGVVFAALLLMGRVGWNFIAVEPLELELELDEVDHAGAAAEVDAWVSEDIAAGAAAPARGWLSQQRNALFEGDPEQVQELIEELHALGAEQVWFTGIEPFGGANLSSSIAAELPVDPDARAAILAREAEFLGEPSPDVGQRYVEFAFD